MAPSAIESLEEPDLVARQLSWISGAVCVALIGFGLLFLISQMWIPAGLLLAGGIAMLVLTRRLGSSVRTTVRLDHAGIHRLGRYAWTVPWTAMRYAGVHPYDTGRVLVVVPEEEVRNWSRRMRNQNQTVHGDEGPLPTGGYVVPVYPDLTAEIEHYIAGHLPGSAQFRPANLKEPKGNPVTDAPTPEPTARDAATPSGDASLAPPAGARPPANGAPGPAPSSDPSISTVEKDPINVRQMWAYSAFAVFAIVWGVTAVMNSTWAAAIVFFVLAALLAFQAWTAFTTRDSEITIDHSGIVRKGGWGWKLPWESISAATVDDYKGRDYLVVHRQNPNAPNHQSSAYLWGSPFAKNALVSPLPWDERDQVREVLEHYAPRIRKRG